MVLSALKRDRVLRDLYNRWNEADKQPTVAFVSNVGCDGPAAVLERRALPGAATRLLRPPVVWVGARTSRVWDVVTGDETYPVPLRGTGRVADALEEFYGLSDMDWAARRKRVSLPDGERVARRERGWSLPAVGTVRGRPVRDILAWRPRSPADRAVQPGTSPPIVALLR